MADKKKLVKCLLCGEKFLSLDDLYLHIEDEHDDEIPPNYTAAQYHYYLKTGRAFGKCVQCGKATDWNTKTNKYHRFCNNPKCKEAYVEEFKSRMINVHGKENLLNDPDQQRKMLANRSISGTYIWSDGTKFPYTGSYEKDFLQFLDKFLGYSSKDIMAPSPHTYVYRYDGKDRFYIPDFYIPSLDLEIEVKDGGENANQHHKIQAVDKAKEKLKDAVMRSLPERNYIKVVNKEYGTLFDALNKFTDNFIDNRKEKVYIVAESMVELDLSDELEDLTHDEDIVMESKTETLTPVYILLTYTGTTMAGMIRKVTNEPYSHASISFESDLDNMYTFGRKVVGDRNMFVAGESVHSGLLGSVASTTNYALYTILVTGKQKKAMQKIIKLFKNNTNISYSWKGLFNIAFNKATEDEDKFFCSQFVAHLLSIADNSLLDRHESLYTPSQLRDIKGVHFVCRGILSNYNKSKVDDKVKQLVAKSDNSISVNEVIQESWSNLSKELLPVTETIGKTDIVGFAKIIDGIGSVEELKDLMDTLKTDPVRLKIMNDKLNKNIWDDYYETSYSKIQMNNLLYIIIQYSRSHTNNTYCNPFKFNDTNVFVLLVEEGTGKYKYKSYKCENGKLVSDIITFELEKEGHISVRAIVSSNENEVDIYGRLPYELIPGYNSYIDINIEGSIHNTFMGLTDKYFKTMTREITVLKR